MARDIRIKDIKIIRTGLENSEEEEKYFAKTGNESCIPLNRDYIPLYADEPCVEACQLLYDLNIQTYTSGGHVDGKENATSEAFIGIVYDSLSEENKQIVRKLIEKGLIDEITDARGRGIHVFSITVPITSDSLVGEVSDQLVAIASLFRQQDVLYGKATLEEIKDRALTKDKYEDHLYYDTLTLDHVRDDEIEKIEVIRQNYADEVCQTMFTEDGVVFYVSEDLLHKHQEYVKQNKGVEL